MKRKYTLPILILLLLVSIGSITYADDLYVDGNKVNFDISPESIGDDTLIPLDQINNNFRLDIIKMADEKVFVYYNFRYLVLNLNRHTASVNGKAIPLKQPPLKVNGHILAPLGLITEFLGIDYSTGDFHLKLPKPVNKSSLEAKLILQKNVYKRNEMLRVNLLLVNSGGHTHVLNFSSGQHYDFYIKDKYGKIVAVWSRGKFFSQATGKIKLDPDESVLFKDSIRLSHLRSGTYRLYGVITSKNEISSPPINIIIK